MARSSSGHLRKPTPRLVLGTVVLIATALLLAACQPVTFGNPGASVGNDIDPANCPGFQATPVAPCGPQPLLWQSISGPFSSFDNGDPYSTRCVAGGGSGTACVQGNALYRATGYDFVVDVGAADVGVALTVEAYDVGSYPRLVGAESPSLTPRDIDDVSTTAASSTVTSPSANFTASDVGRRISLGNTSSSRTIAAVTDATTAEMSATATATGITTATIGFDCNTSSVPFNGANFSGMTSQNCQTGDLGDASGQNMDVQLFATDGTSTPSFATAVAGCHLSRSAAELRAARATYKNKWIELCTFTPVQKGVYALRVRSSGIPGMTDVGTGYDNYALKVVGGSATGLRPAGDQSVFRNPPSAIGREYLLNVPKNFAGKKIVLDMFDPGDGSGPASFSVQVLAPPSGAPSVVPTSGAVVPAAGLATQCRYNAVGSATIAPATPDVADTCRVTTHNNGTSVYNGKWLRIEVTLDAAYECATDCWWTLRSDFGVAGLPTDRVTFTAKVVDA